ncbi:MAG TPA: DUF4416 family protein [Candidatus Kapabacteria bacterium]|nr:DUF4416 family protein [Candidatus Kapabacteria bacterium]
MGIEKEFNKVKLFSGIIYGNTRVYEEIKKILADLFSPVDLEVGPFDFVFTTYYNREMGSPLFRRFISFEKLISPEELPDIKIRTDQIEMETAVNGNRLINLDPGYLSEANVIIATTKNHYHRVPLSKGIYAHIEYVIKKKKIIPLEWTYPDFKTPQYIAFFERLNLLFKQKDH